MTAPLTRVREGCENNRDCGLNVICPEAEPYQDLVNAVSWLDMGAYICTGSMLNNVRQDLTPYYMTAWHCTDGDNPSTFRFYFNYETTTCSASWGSYGSYAYGSVSEEDSNGMDSDWDLLRITGTAIKEFTINRFRPFVEPLGAPKILHLLLPSRIVFPNFNGSSIDHI